jgi:hypothetical protein
MLTAITMLLNVASLTLLVIAVRQVLKAQAAADAMHALRMENYRLASEALEAQFRLLDQAGSDH